MTTVHHTSTSDVLHAAEKALKPVEVAARHLVVAITNARVELGQAADEAARQQHKQEHPELYPLEDLIPGLAEDLAAPPIVPDDPQALADFYRRQAEEHAATAAQYTAALARLEASAVAQPTPEARKERA